MNTKAPSNIDSHVGYWLRFVSNHIHYAFKNELVKHAVTPAEWVILRCIFNVEPCTQTKIIESINIDKGAISKVIERLYKRKLLLKKAGKQDKRQTIIELTEKGRTLVPALASLADDNDHHFFNHLTKTQHQQLIEILKDMVKIHRMKDLPIN